MTKRLKPNHTVSEHSMVNSAGRLPAAIYNRVSTEDQDPEKAMRDLRAAVGVRGYAIALEVAETGSGRRNDRPGLQRVLEAARRGEVSAVFVARLDRFGRSATDLQVNIEQITKAGVRFVCTEQGLDLSGNGDPMTNLMLQMLSAFAQFEHALITTRVREGVRRARERGVRFGRKPKTGPTPEQVAGLRTAGRSWAEIAGELGCTVALARRRAVEA